MGKKTVQQSQDNTPRPQIDFIHYDEGNHPSHDPSHDPSHGQVVEKSSTKNSDGNEVVEEIVMNNPSLGANLPVATSLDDKIPVTTGADLYYKDNGCE